MMTIYDDLLGALKPGKILDVQVGISRTAVLAETEAGIRCGLAATLTNPEYDHRSQPAVRNAGHLLEMDCADLAGLVKSPSFTEVAVGLAAINALLPRNAGDWTEINAGDYLAQQAADKNVAVVGHFSFINRVKPLAKNLWVLELNPKEDDLPARAAPEIIPRADLVAITATTLINKTFQGLIELCQTNSRVVLVGPSTPLTPVMYEHGIDILSGAIVTDPQAAMRGISQGSSLQQLRQDGIVRFITLQKGS